MEDEAAILGKKKSWVVSVSAHGAAMDVFKFVLFPF